MRGGKLDKDNLIKIFKVFGIIILTITIILGIASGITAYCDQFYIEHYDKEVTISNKETVDHTTYIHSGKVLVPVISHSYKIYGTKGEEMGVSSAEYYSINASDHIVAECTIIYYKKDNSIYRIEYKFKELLNK